jgi:hypothetical protein
MPNISDGRLALGLAGALAIWLFGVLPFLYGPPPRFSETRGPPQGHTEQTGQQSAAKPDGSVSAPIFVKIPKTAEEGAQEAEDRKEKSATDWWLMIFTGAVALFTFLLVAATIMLYRAGEKQLRHAETTAQRELRAYVTITQAKPGFDMAGDLTAVIQITNCGQTPAYNVSATRDIQVLDWQNPEFPPITNERTPRFTLGKDQPMAILLVLKGISGVNDMRGDRFDADRAIYIFGEITYHDVFREQLRRTPFRLICVRDDDGSFAFVPTPEGNDAD